MIAVRMGRHPALLFCGTLDRLQRILKRRDPRFNFGGFLRNHLVDALPQPPYGAIIQPIAKRTEFFRVRVKTRA